MEPYLVNASNLNRNGLFQSIGYTSTLHSQLTSPLRSRYLNTVKDVLDDLAAIKYNPAYCQFISKNIGFNLEQGFDNLSQGSLNIQLIHGGEKFEEYAPLYKTKNNYIFGLRSSEYSLRNRSDDSLRTVIAHDISHHLLHSMTKLDQAPIPRDNVANELEVYTDKYKKNWAIELGCDKIAVASNPNNNIGKFLDEHTNNRGYINHLYQDGLLPKGTAQLLSLFCKTRDHAILTIGKTTSLMNGNNALMYFMNGLFQMKTSAHHPSDIVRAVEGDKFTRKANEFRLKNEL